MRTIVAAFIAATFALWPNQGHAQYGEPYHCQILDRVDDPIWDAYFGYVEQADVDLSIGSDFSIYELGVHGGFVYLRTDYGDFDIGGRFDLQIFSDDGGVDLPDQVGELVVDIEWTKRYYSNRALQFGIAPGIYSDFEEFSGDSIFIPFWLNGIFAFHPDASAIIGFRIYPDFNKAFDPNIGIRWAASDSFTLDLFYPESKITYVLNNQWELVGGLDFNLVSEYQLEDDDPRDRFEYRDARAYIGANLFLTDQVLMNFEVGQAFGREIEFADDDPARPDRDFGTADVDDAFYIRIGISGLL